MSSPSPFRFVRAYLAALLGLPRRYVNQKRQKLRGYVH